MAIITINNIDELIAFANGDYGRGTSDEYIDVALTSDIDFATDNDGEYKYLDWQGCTGSWYINFDGGGHTIKNISYTGTNVWAFFYSLLGNATVKNLKLTDINIITTSAIYGISRFGAGNQTIENCHISGSFNGNNIYTIAYNDYSGGTHSIKNCTFSGILTSTGVIYGIALGNFTTRIVNCAVNADIYTSGSVVLVGGSTRGSTTFIARCFFKGTVTAGGTIIFANGGTVIQNYVVVKSVANGQSIDAIKCLYDATVAEASGITYSSGTAATTEQLKSRAWLREQGWAV